MMIAIRALNRTFIIIAFAVGCVIAAASSIRAQDTLEVPAPSSQNPPPRIKRPPPRKKVTTERIIRQREVHEEEEVVEPAPPPPPPPPPIEAYQPGEPLPEVFRGCWEGVVPAVDSMQRAPGAPPLGPWTTKSYRLCYRRVGDGPFKLTFTDLGVARHHLIANPGGHLEVVSTDGRSYATMRALLHFDERYIRPNYFRSTFLVEEVTDLNAEILGDSMRVSAKVHGARDRAPWFTATWHAIFVHTAD